MIISTQTSYLGQALGDFEAVKTIAEVGFDAVDYSMFYIHEEQSPLHGNGYEKHVRELKHIADESGIYFNQAHAPFPSFKDNNDNFNKRNYEYTLRTLEICSIINAPHIVIHPSLSDYRQNERNIDFYNSLLPYCKQYNVKIAIENLNENDPSTNTYSMPEHFTALIDSLDSEWFFALLDIGHAELSGNNAADYIRYLGGKRLRALHVQDNDRIHDSHTLPFTKNFDWKSIMQALKDINYTGGFTFEADKFLRQFPIELAKDASRLMLAVGRYLTSLAE